jgi:SAM-dependent methyltransferase
VSGPEYIFDLDVLASRLDRTAADAGAHDFLLQRVANDFEERLSVINRSFAHVLSIGAGENVLLKRLVPLLKPGTQLSAGVSGRLLEQGGGAAILLDSEVMPFAPGSFDLIVSGLGLQLVNDLPGVMAQLARALKPDGLFLAALLGGETLKELREAWLVAEAEVTGGASPRVAPFADVRELGVLLQRAGLALPVADSDVVRVTYSSPLALMQELKAMGASNMLAERRRVPVTRGLLMRAAEVYQERFGLSDSRIPATFEIVTLTGWAPHESQQKPLRPGSAQQRLADALGAQELGAGDKAVPGKQQ